MAASLIDTTIIEEREELMVPPYGGDPTPKVAHFLKPSVPSSPEPLFHLLLPLPPPNSINNPKLNNFLNISFNGCRYPQKGWKKWVSRMHYLYQNIWKEAGVHDAILNSTYEIHPNDDLIIGFSEKWRCETNTFVFSWGEATITLEDMIFLGGYSVLGDSAFSVLEDEEDMVILDKLEQARIGFNRCKSKKAAHGAWLSRFMDSGCEIEHEAFLALWLSRFVFLKVKDFVSKNVFPIAVRLAKGTRIALAPAILASIYRDLRLIKNTIIKCSKVSKGNPLSLVVCSPLLLVQIWIFERFPMLRVGRNQIENGEPRFARWDDKQVKKSNIDHRMLATDSASKKFRWCPYGLWPCKFYNEKDRWILLDCGLYEELESFACCLRVSELVGIDCDCIEQYLPHRVAMQFGLGQDLPGNVPRANATARIAWKNYTRPIGDIKLFFPSRFFEPCVTTRYLNGWNQLGEKDGRRVATETCKNFTSSILPDLKEMKLANDALVPPGFRPRWDSMQVSSSFDEFQQTVAKHFRSIASENIEPATTPPTQTLPSVLADDLSFEKENCVKSEPEKRWDEEIVAVSVSSTETFSHKGVSKAVSSSEGTAAPICIGMKANIIVPPSFPQTYSGSDDEDKKTIAELLRRCGRGRKTRDFRVGPSIQNSASSSAANNGSFEMENAVNTRVSKELSGDMTDSGAEAVAHTKVSLEREKGECSSLQELEAFASACEARVSKLEKIFALLKVAKISNRLD